MTSRTVFRIAGFRIASCCALLALVLGGGGLPAQGQALDAAPSLRAGGPASTATGPANTATARLPASRAAREDSGDEAAGSPRSVVLRAQAVGLEVELANRKAFRGRSGSVGPAGLSWVPSVKPFSPPGTPQVQPEETNRTWWYVAGGAVLVAGGVLAAVLLTGDEDGGDTGGTALPPGRPE